MPRLRKRTEKSKKSGSALSKLEGEGAAVENERALLENNIENHKTNIVRIEGELAGWSKREG